MIIRGELTETHKKRLASMDRSVHVHVMPLGAVSSEGLRLFKEYARAFKRHRFYLAVRSELQDSVVLNALAAMPGAFPNAHIWIIKGDISGTEISRWHTRMEKGPASAAALGSGENQGAGK